MVIDGRLYDKVVGEGGIKYHEAGYVGMIKIPFDDRIIVFLGIG